MKNLKLPVTIDPYKSAQRRLVVDGFFELCRFERLLGEADKATEHVNVVINFDVDEQGLIVISGKASTQVYLTCQRCNEPFEQELKVDFSFSPAKNEEKAGELPEHYDAVVLDENGEVNLRDLVEDELLVSIPLIPKHNLEDCGQDANTTWGKLPDTLEKPNPFDVLKNLK
ncbi:MULTISPECIES: 23S rRNA accumulation protein YceD [unclassified Thalassotalea]|uniref:23S rRNA accumulation protein YceD n=1 Tax=unclassified Thalassotalea TaxID=2614972 RepID=UPI0010801112|nr:MULTISPECIES: 23S rRNA accumulation protein YceD [unclassified Thalassotalea]NMP15567.1 23S rRNA accumulation protein YceD [Thalassotalea sp. Y01]QBY05788.1 23S rRNA accumulation protein YceD [Thalassotalea sp. HSM 43]